MTDTEIGDSVDGGETVVLRKESGQDGPQGLLEDLRAKHVAFVSWVVAAGTYGYSIGEWGNAAVDTATAQPYPEYAWVFLTLGVAIGVAFSASVAALPSEDDADE